MPVSSRPIVCAVVGGSQAAATSARVIALLLADVADAVDHGAAFRNRYGFSVFLQHAAFGKTCVSHRRSDSHAAQTGRTGTDERKARGVVPGVAARRRSVTVNLAESPLGWLHAHGHLDDRLFDAGERLRADYERAQLSPGVTMRWEPVRIRGTGGAARADRAADRRARSASTARSRRRARGSRTSCGAWSAPARRCRLPKRRSNGPRAAASWCSGWRSTGWRISTGSE